MVASEKVCYQRGSPRLVFKKFAPRPIVPISCKGRLWRKCLFVHFSFGQSNDRHWLRLFWWHFFAIRFALRPCRVLKFGRGDGKAVTITSKCIHELGVCLNANRKNKILQNSRFPLDLPVQQKKSGLLYILVVGWLFVYQDFPDSPWPPSSTKDRLDQTRPDQTKPDKTKPDQTRTDQTRPVGKVWIVGKIGKVRKVGKFEKIMKSRKSRKSRKSMKSRKSKKIEKNRTFQGLSQNFLRTVRVLHWLPWLCFRR